MGYFETWRKIADKSATVEPCLCDKWRHYRGWLEDVTQLPGADPSAVLRRLDAGRMYEPGNVRWVPRGKVGRQLKDPHAPRSNRVFHLTHNGQPITQKEAAALLGITTGAFWQRMNYRYCKPDRFLKEKGNHFDLNEFLWDDTYPDWKKPRMNQKFYLFWQGKQIKFPEAMNILKLKPDELYEKLHVRQGKTSRNCFDVEEFMWE